jgi:hypothetical protein
MMRHTYDKCTPYAPSALQRVPFACTGVSMTRPRERFLVRILEILRRSSTTSEIARSEGLRMHEGSVGARNHGMKPQAKYVSRWA